MTLSHRLEKYLQDNSIPYDIENYFPDGPDSMFCVFCGLEHDNIPFTHSEDSLEQNTYKCAECSNIIENHLTRGQINIDFMEEKIRQNNLRDYSQLFYLPIDKLDYLKGGEHEGKCIFCRQRPIGVPWYLEVPCGESLHSYGGMVAVCDRCNNWLLDRNTTLSVHTAHVDTCPECSAEYPVASSEYQTRASLHTRGKHVCPECFYKEHEPRTRLITYEYCEVCETQIVNDLTQVKDNPTKIHFPKIYCNICSLVSHEPAEEVIIKHPIPQVYINISTHHKGYAIYRIDERRRKASIITTADDISKDHKPEDIAYKASKRAYELLKEGLIETVGRQAKLLL